MYDPIPQSVQDERELQEKQLSRYILKVSVKVMCWAVFAPCLLLGVYGMGFYLKTLVANDFEAWEIGIPKMYHPECPASNAGILAHIFAGAFIMVGVPIQFIRGIRRNFGIFHRWNGRLVIVCSCVLPLGVLTYTFLVGDVMGRFSAVVNSIEVLIMLVCAAETYRHAAWTKKIERHQLWSYRLFAIAIANLLVRLYIVGIYLLLPSIDIFTATYVATFLSLVPSFVFIEVWWRRKDKKQTPVLNWLWIACVWAAIAFLCLTTIIFASAYWIPMLFKDLETLKRERLQNETGSG